MSLVDRALPLLEAVLDEVRSLMGDLQIERTDRQQLVTAALLATVVEISIGIAVALRVGNGTSAYILFRSLLEAFVDLLNVSQDQGYVACMDAAFLDQQRRILVSAVERRSKSSFLTGIAGDPAAEEQLENIRLRLRELKARGVEPLTVKDRFERADQLDYYEGPYAQLCWHSHNNINVLERRHLRQNEEGLSIVVGAPLKDDDVQIITDTTAGLAANSVAAAKSLLEAGTPSGLDNLGRRLDELRRLWRSST